MNVDTQTQFSLAETQTAISQLAESLLTANPTMPSLLRTIHSKLKSDPAIVTLLTEEEIAEVITALKVQTNVELSAPAKAKAASTKAPSATSRLNAILKSSKISSDDF